MNLDDCSNHSVASARQQKKVRPRSAGDITEKATVATEDEYDDDDFCDDDSASERSHTATPSGLSNSPESSWMGNQNYHDGMIDMSTQTVMHSGINRSA